MGEVGGFWICFEGELSRICWVGPGERARGGRRERQVEDGSTALAEQRRVKVLPFTETGSWFGGDSEGFSFLMPI